jgi:hypothetical protein
MDRSPPVTDEHHVEVQNSETSAQTPTAPRLDDDPLSRLLGASSLDNSVLIGNAKKTTASSSSSRLTEVILFWNRLPILGLSLVSCISCLVCLMPLTCDLCAL